MKLLKAKTLDEAQRMIADGAVPVGGATVLAQQRQQHDLIDLSNLRELKQLTIDGDGMRIGALATIEQIARHGKIRQLLPALSQAANSIGSPQSRRMGTLGGNIALYMKGELPAADLVPALAVLGANIRFANRALCLAESLHGQRWRRGLITTIGIGFGGYSSAFRKYGNRDGGGSSVTHINCAVAKRGDETYAFAIAGIANELKRTIVQVKRPPGEAFRMYDREYIETLLQGLLPVGHSEYKRSLACYGVWECLRQIQRKNGP